MMKLMAAWARERGIPRPTTPEGMRLLTARFLEEFKARAQEVVVGAAGDATYDSDPIAQMEHPLHLVRNSGGMIDVTEPSHATDDFSELVRDRNRAMEEAGGDELAAEVIYRDQIRHETASEPQMRNPISAEGAALGASALVKSGTTQASAPTVANWSDKDARTRMVAIAFSMAPVDPGFGAFSVKPVGYVQFGTAAYSALMEVDIGTGCIFALPASQVLLSVGNDAALAGENASTLQLSGMLSFDPVSKSTPLTRTVVVDNIPHQTTTGGIPIKPFAKRVWFYRTPITGTVSIEFHNSALQTLYSVPIAANAVQSAPIPIANDVTTIVINNNDAAVDITHGRLIFELEV